MKLIHFILAAAAALPGVSYGDEMSICGNVKYISPTPPLSGYLSTWIKITIDRENEKLDFYIHYVKMNEYIPNPGKKCVFKYHFGDVKGIVGGKNDNIFIKNAMIVDSIFCD